MDFGRLLQDKKVVLLDGAMGTQLDKKGLMGRATANLEAPQAVLEVHRAYAQAACDALITNTTNRESVTGASGAPLSKGTAVWSFFEQP